MQADDSLREFTFVQNPRVADHKQLDASNLVAGLNVILSLNQYQVYYNIL